jgi:polyisoprenoid-binding protein YceI
MYRMILLAGAALALSACAPMPPAAPALAATPTHAPTPVIPMRVSAPAGAYTLDKSHSSLIFRVDHLGFSHFTGRFTTFDAHLTLDPAAPEHSHIEVAIDPASISSDNAPKGFLDLLRGAPWFEAAKFPKMTFTSTKVELTAPNAARVTGDFEMHGITRPVTLEAVFNGGYPGMAMDPHARIGVSAHGQLKRSEFGISTGVPRPPMNFGVGDDVDIIIETEFSGPAWTPPGPAPSAPGAATPR